MFITAVSRIAVAIGALTLGLTAIGPTVIWAIEPVEQTKKSVQTGTSLLAKDAIAPKFSTAETAGKAPSCFGEAPNLDKRTPDEGKAGYKVTTTGTNFGVPACLHGISFGLAHPAQRQQTNDRITTTVPSDGKNGLVLLTVRTAFGENSTPFFIKQRRR